MTEDIAKEILEPLLEKIGWSLRFVGGDHYRIVNHNGVNTNWEIWKNRLEMRPETHMYEKDKYESWTIVFDMKLCKADLLSDGNCVSVFDRKNKAIFALFMNHDMKRVGL